MTTTQLPEKATLSIKETAKYLGIAELTVRKAVALGEIPSFRLSGRVLIPRRAIEDLLGGAA